MNDIVQPINLPEQEKDSDKDYEQEETSSQPQQATRDLRHPLPIVTALKEHMSQQILTESQSARL